jgi:hypothetical protein
MHFNLLVVWYVNLRVRSGRVVRQKLISTMAANTLAELADRYESLEAGLSCVPQDLKAEAYAVGLAEAG